MSRAGSEGWGWMSMRGKRLLDLFSAFGQASVVVCRHRGLNSPEDRHLHSGNVVDARFHFFVGLSHVLNDGVLDVARRVFDLRQSEVALFECFAHRLFRFEDRPKQSSQSHRQCVGLLLEE